MQKASDESPTLALMRAVYPVFRAGRVSPALRSPAAIARVIKDLPRPAAVRHGRRRRAIPLPPPRT